MDNSRNKFRVWDKKEKTYIDSEELGINQGGLLCKFREGGGYAGAGYYETGSFCSIDNSNNYIIEQCTGFKDRNGKLGFYKDIIRIGNTQYQIVICTEYESFWIKLIGTRFEDELSYQALSKTLMECSEIIGNIHEKEKQNE